MGNICRSPTAEAVFRHHVAKQGLMQRITIDSAGTHAYHIGEPPDERARRYALRRGYDLSPLRGRQVERADFESFDLMLAMDRQNLQRLTELRGKTRSMQSTRDARIELLLAYGGSQARSTAEVPDPYYGGEVDFERVLDLVEDAAQGLLRHIQVKLS